MKPFTAFTAEDFQANLSTNLVGFFHITQRAAAQMLKQGSGHVVSITTSLTDHANASVPSVLASLTKGGINSATKSLAIEFADKGVRVNAVSPGVIKTPMHAHLAYCTVEIRDMETGVKAGDSSCGDAMAHESPNNAKSVNEAITIEFKNRDRFKP